jgi:hypothetical protein
MMNYRDRLRCILVVLLSALSAACTPHQAERVPAEALHQTPTAPSALLINTPLIGLLGAVNDPSATPISAARHSPAPEQLFAQIGTPAFRATFGPVLDSSPPLTRPPSSLPTSEMRSTSPFGPVVDPNHTPLPSPTFSSSALPAPTALPFASAVVPSVQRASLCGFKGLNQRRQSAR